MAGEPATLPAMTPAAQDTKPENATQGQNTTDQATPASSQDKPEQDSETKNLQSCYSRGITPELINEYSTKVLEDGTKQVTSAILDSPDLYHLLLEKHSPSLTPSRCRTSIRLILEQDNSGRILPEVREFLLKAIKSYGKRSWGFQVALKRNNKTKKPAADTTKAPKERKKIARKRPLSASGSADVEATSKRQMTNVVENRNTPAVDGATNADMVYMVPQMRYGMQHGMVPVSPMSQQQQMMTMTQQQPQMFMPQHTQFMNQGVYAGNQQQFVGFHPPNPMQAMMGYNIMQPQAVNTRPTAQASSQSSLISNPMQPQVYTVVNNGMGVPMNMAYPLGPGMQTMQPQMVVLNQNGEIQHISSANT
mmetsp:Transcript_13105/g.21229  ORF Transcript_13105/g.21229 Transcript_13105/m.21229 type:complete len:364 (+) Transcript_13105:292-1383(+)